jgi:CBS domain-containing membrane protein
MPRQIEHGSMKISAKLGNLLAWAASWLGLQHRTPLWRMVVSGLGGAIGIGAVELMVRHGSAAIILAAPIGASAVLLFAVPASPLAQPWAIVGGNTVSALCGIACLKLIGDPAIAAPLAVGCAIAAMGLARCLHPPGGACALTAVIGGPPVIAAGWSFALLPVALDSALLVVAGLVVQRLLQTHYPHHGAAHVVPASPVSGVTVADIERVLAQYPDLLDVEADDLAELFHLLEQQTRA